MRWVPGRSRERLWFPEASIAHLSGLVMEVASYRSNLPAIPVSDKILGVQPNRLENLDDLLAQAEHYANYSMRNIGRLPPTLFLIGSKGPVMFLPEALADESDKNGVLVEKKLSIPCRLARRPRKELFPVRNLIRTANGFEIIGLPLLDRK